MTTPIINLEDASFESLQLVGGKAASLGEMIRTGVMVPSGFVVTADAFRSGIDETLKRETFKAFDALGAERVAVRSSAGAEDSKTASWAGQLESYLNVSRAGLMGALEKCWASVSSERAKEYAREQGGPQGDQAVAVVVQAMVDSELSGVMFTANPVTGDQEELLIEAVAGLGELLVQGEVTPESLVVSKAGRVMSRESSRQNLKLVYKEGENRRLPIVPPDQLVSDALLGQLVDVGRKIEEGYGAPQDIEWAVEGGKLWVVQARPITTLAQKPTITATFEKAFTREESLVLVEILAQEVDAWLKTVVPDPPRSMFFRFHQGLTETWLGEEATQMLVDHVYERNIRDPDYLPELVRTYKEITAKLAAIEKKGAAFTLPELKEYLALFRTAIVPIHVIFFTPFRDDTPRQLYNLAVKTRGEDALFDNGDLVVRDSLVKIYPECDGYETFIGLQDLDKPDLAKLPSRENNFICVGGNYLPIGLDQFRAGHPEYIFKLDEVSAGQTTVTGNVAYQGLAQGKAQVVMRKRQVVDFRQGNVLVAPMTTPHYLPAMRKAIAFVTDEGGITSHAAIVAREMQKPCVIGTRIATQVIKNGDEVMVEARERGEVRVL